MLSDLEHRRQATDPRHSFIVQAPAGSGKTEILSQRFLRLLATVKMPEQIIALTFTRKAANEMRERILSSLYNAAQGVEANSEHQKQTNIYAQQALQQDKALNWQLLQHPGRLRILTIDSLCQRLTQAIPLQEKQIPYAQVGDKPQSHYKKAALACLNHALHNEALQSLIKPLLAHLDNRQDKLLELFCDLLAKRDQWLAALHQAKSQEKHHFEQALEWIEQHELTRFCQTLPATLADELNALVRQLANIDTHSDSPRLILRDWEIFDEMDRHIAASLAGLLLTSQNKLRKSFDHHVGLKRGACEDTHYDQLKTASKRILAELTDYPEFLEALLRIRQLPEPLYNSEQWQILQALLNILPILAAHLYLVFSEQNEVDFTAISQQALQALGEEEQPTDLALYLDHQIQHLLVDEFQDTSLQQFQLLTRLVQEWQHGDGKTLFVVGDPMQSIYRFRAAEVGLFLRARQYGIGPVTLTPLALSCNFRSTAAIVEWVNQHFQTIFPQNDDIESGAVRFHSSDPIQAASEWSHIKAYECSNSVQEAEAMVNVIQAELQTHPDDDIALLVRSRTQLTEVVQRLRTHDIPFQGVEIDLLSHLPHLRDVWSLTQSLLLPGNRLAWLAFLRSPWCGIDLSDIHRIALFAPKNSIYYALSKLDEIKELTEPGRMRVQYIYQVMHAALTTRHQQPLVDWLIKTLEHLHLDHVLNTREQDDLEQFWRLLEQFERNGQIGELELFKSEFNKLYSQRVNPARLQIMTIHKSKGLEFDCVILPSLGAKTSGQDLPLLRWLKLPTQQQELLLVSPIKAAHHEQCLLYDYLGKLESQKNHYEMQRLLYVAVTRAKKRLYLFDNRDKVRQGSFRHLLQNQTFVTPDFLENADHNQEKPDENTLANHPNLYHLPIDFYQTPPIMSMTGTRHPSHLETNLSRHIGIIGHELLQWICDHHPETLHEVPWVLAQERLNALGLEEELHQEAQNQLHEQISKLFTDPIGQWLIKHHEQERNEYALMLTDPEQGFSTRILDRTFCENGVRWIIDFKTGADDEITQKKHRQQVSEYARIMTQLDPQPIRCGLYYLSTGYWVDWDANDQQD